VSDDAADELILRDGEAHCPVDDCDWWMTEGEDLEATHRHTYR